MFIIYNVYYIYISPRVLSRVQKASQQFMFEELVHFSEKQKFHTCMKLPNSFEILLVHFFKHCSEKKKVPFLGHEKIQHKNAKCLKK